MTDSATAAPSLEARLRDAADVFERYPSQVYGANYLCREAADRIAELEAQLTTLAGLPRVDGKDGWDDLNDLIRTLLSEQEKGGDATPPKV